MNIIPIGKKEWFAANHIQAEYDTYLHTAQDKNEIVIGIEEFCEEFYAHYLSYCAGHGPFYDFKRFGI